MLFSSRLVYVLYVWHLNQQMQHMALTLCGGLSLLLKQ